MDPWANEILKLYQDCRERAALPEAGGIMDQNAETMMWFRVLDEKLAEHRKTIEKEKSRA